MLAPHSVLEGPQSNWGIHGTEDFARLNAEYPITSRQKFRISRLVASSYGLVTQVSVTDETYSSEATSHFEAAHGRITRLGEHWARPYAPPRGRSHMAEPIA